MKWYLLKRHRCIKLNSNNLSKYDSNNLSKYEQRGFTGGSVVKNLPASAGDAGDVGLIPGSGRCPGEGNGKPSSTLAWRIPWTEEPGGLQTVGPQSRTRQNN